MTITRTVTPLQRAVLDALGGEARTAATLAFDMGLTRGAVWSRLLSLWRKGLVDREFRGGDIMVWWVT